MYFLAPPATNQGLEQTMSHCTNKFNLIVCTWVSVWDTGGLKSSLRLIAYPVKKEIIKIIIIIIINYEIKG